MAGCYAPLVATHPASRLLPLLHRLLAKRVAERAASIARSARTSPSPSLVLSRLAQEMLQMGPLLAPRLLAELMRGASRLTPGFAEALRTLGDVRGLAAQAGADFMMEVVRSAGEQGLEEVVALFAATPPRRKAPTLDEIEASRPPADYLPLGVRKFQARRPDGRFVEALLLDQDPAVIRNLLDNPRLTEELVVKMASRRPTSPEVLQEIAIHRVWGARGRVRAAVAFNPFAAPRLVQTILPHLPVQDILLVAQAPALHPALQAAARRILLTRMGEMKPEERRAFRQRNSAALKAILVLE